MQLGYSHALEGYPYAWKLDVSRMTDEQIRNYARGYLWSNPVGKAAKQKQFRGNITRAKRDAEWDEGVFGFFKLLGKCFGG